MSASVRLDKLLANLGYGSRRDVNILVRNGKVTLDGAVGFDPRGERLAVHCHEGNVFPLQSRLLLCDAARMDTARYEFDPLPAQ